jgi:hypothetical protein
MQRLPMRARAVDRTVRPVHGSTADRPLKHEGVRDLNRPREIQRPRTHASEGRRRRRRRAAARDRGSMALSLDGVLGHHSDHEQVQNEAGALVHVTGGSMGAIMPRRRSAPEGGGAAAPVSLWVRCCAQKEGKTGGEILLTVQRRSG